MSPQRRGATEDPHPDYLDQGRPVTDARTRPPRQAAKQPQETGHPTSSNEQKGTPMIASSTSAPPEGFEPVDVPRFRAALDALN